MLKNIFLFTVRRFRKKPGVFLINLFGLTIGMASFILIFLWIDFELGYDRHFENSDRIYRVTTDVNLNSGQKKYYVYSTSGLAAALVADYPDVKAATRLRPARQILIRNQEKSFFESGFLFADPNFFKVFAVPLLHGNREQALLEPRSLLLTERMARKYFGEDDPVGKTLLVDQEEEYRVTGILGELPGNTHFSMDFLAYPGEVDIFNPPTWMSLSLCVYALVDEGVNAAGLESRIQDLAEKNAGPRGKEIFTFRLQPLTSIHLKSRLEGEFAPVTNILQIYLLSAIGFLILIVAGINFVNLSTAQAGQRAREVGMRKVLGAFGLKLRLQFLGESLFSTLLSFLVGLFLTALFLPIFNSLTGVSLKLEFSGIMAFLGLVVIALGLAAGIYPAVLLSSFQPSTAFRGVIQGGRSGLAARRTLIVFQFSVTVILMISTCVVYKQVRFMKNLDLGFEKEQVITVRIRNQGVMQEYESVKSELMQNPRILSASASSSLPGFPIAQRAYIPEGFEGNPIMVLTLYTDHDFIKTMGLQIKAGRDFSRNFATDVKTAYIINETARIRFGWDDPIGKQIICTNTDEEEDTASGTVIGVVKNFHFRSLHQVVEPIVLRIHPERFLLMNLKLQSDDLQGAISFIRKNIERRQPEFPFEFWFLDSRLSSLYRNEERLAGVFSSFSLVAIIIACLGLFGLAAYLAERRTREIGIRKVLGAGTGHIVGLIMKDFFIWIALSNLIAWPTAYWVMGEWLQNFPFRAGIGILVMAGAGLAAAGIALSTVGVRAWRAARVDPVLSLKFE